jgi:hypothetical protein
MVEKKPLKIVSFCAVALLVLTSLNAVGGQTVQAVGERKVVSQNKMIDFVLGGILGDNGWYISDVTVTIINQNYNHTYFRIDDGDWSEYEVPLIVGDDGLHLVEATSDFEHIFNVSFKIDTTPPEVHITIQRHGCRVLITLDVIENMSGVLLIEFYSHGALIASVTTPPYEFLIEVGLFGEHTVSVIVYDAAGNNAEASITFPYSTNHMQRNVSYQFLQFLRNIILLYQLVMERTGVLL